MAITSTITIDKHNVGHASYCPGRDRDLASSPHNTLTHPASISGPKIQLATQHVVPGLAMCSSHNILPRAGLAPDPSLPPEQQT